MAGVYSLPVTISTGSAFFLGFARLIAYNERQVELYHQIKTERRAV